MNLLIFGATGGTGSAIVAQALEQGHRVTAFARNPDAIKTKHENLVVVQGDILDYASVERAVKRQDAVLSALGTKAIKRHHYFRWDAKYHHCNGEIRGQKVCVRIIT
jgi:putative NADH-flavin reductase